MNEWINNSTKILLSFKSSNTYQQTTMNEWINISTKISLSFKSFNTYSANHNEWINNSGNGIPGLVAVAAEVLEPLLGSGSQWCQFHRRKKKERTWRSGGRRVGGRTGEKLKAKVWEYCVWKTRKRVFGILRIWNKCVAWRVLGLWLEFWVQ